MEPSGETWRMASFDGAFGAWKRYQDKFLCSFGLRVVNHILVCILMRLKAPTAGEPLSIASIFYKRKPRYFFISTDPEMRKRRLWNFNIYWKENRKILLKRVKFFHWKLKMNYEKSGSRIFLSKINPCAFQDSSSLCRDATVVSHWLNHFLSHLPTVVKSLLYIVEVQKKGFLHN